MKILLVITGLGMGGAEKVVVTLADALVERGHDAAIVYMTGPALTLPTNAAVKITNLNMKSKFYFIQAFLRLRRIIIDFKPDVVHSHMIHANIICRLMRTILPIRRLISTAHNTNEGGASRMLAYRLTGSLADVSTNVSEDAVRAFIKAGATRPGHMIAVHNGVDVEKYAFNSLARRRVRVELGIGMDYELLLAVGRFNKQKDYPNLFGAAVQLAASGAKFKLCIVGDGPLREELKQLTHKLNLQNYVRFLGVRLDVPDLMSAADVFVLSSAWEGFPMVVMEAMANERLVVATDCGGTREAIGVTGHLSQPMSSSALALALEAALSLSAKERATLGCAARQRVVDRYSLEAATEKWLMIYAGKSNA